MSSRADKLTITQPIPQSCPTHLSALAPSIPPELILMIIGHCDRETLVTMLRVSEFALEVAGDRLYRNLTITPNNVKQVLSGLHNKSAAKRGYTRDFKKRLLGRVRSMELFMHRERLNSLPDPDIFGRLRVLKLGRLNHFEKPLEERTLYPAFSPPKAGHTLAICKVVSRVDQITSDQCMAPPVDTVLSTTWMGRMHFSPMT
jgi:hypothetical protein